MSDSKSNKPDPGASKQGPRRAPSKGPRASKARYKAALRNAFRRNAHEPDINFLNITAMLDIMTIILVFLLKNLGESSASIPQSDDLTIPKSILDTEPSQEGVRVTISKSQIMVGENVVLKLPERRALIESGAGAANKQGGPSDLFIVPLGSALQDARKVDKAVRLAKGKDASMSEAVIIADQTTPWRLFIEVLFTLGQSEYGRYHLMVMQSKGG
jgi:biopolymer transport protein ExbD